MRKLRARLQGEKLGREDCYGGDPSRGGEGARRDGKGSVRRRGRIVPRASGERVSRKEWFHWVFSTQEFETKAEKCFLLHLDSGGRAEPGSWGNSKALCAMGCSSSPVYYTGLDWADGQRGHLPPGLSVVLPRGLIEKCLKPADCPVIFEKGGWVQEWVTECWHRLPTPPQLGLLSDSPAAEACELSWPGLERGMLFIFILCIFFSGLLIPCFTYLSS